jgi:hypothetical protein
MRMGTRLMVSGMMPGINTRARQTTLMIVSTIIYPRVRHDWAGAHE